MNRTRVRLIVWQHAWYPEPIRCGLCHKETHDLYRVHYKEPGTHPSKKYKAAGCADCIREMQVTQ